MVKLNVLTSNSRNKAGYTSARIEDREPLRDMVSSYDFGDRAKDTTA